MTLELAIILITALLCFTAMVLAILLAPGIWPGRDDEARDRDRGLAKLYEARADLMQVESMERRAVIRRRDALDARIAARRNRPGEVRACDERAPVSYSQE